jgi:hypothetical protein
MGDASVKEASKWRDGLGRCDEEREALRRYDAGAPSNRGAKTVPLERWLVVFWVFDEATNKRSRPIGSGDDRKGATGVFVRRTIFGGEESDERREEGAGRG